MYYYNNELPPQQGWVCPKCGRVNAPWMPTCGCVSSQTSGTPYLVGISSISRDSHEIAKTEPQTCEECKHWNDTEDDCADRHGCRTTTEDCSTVKPQNYCDDCLYCDTCDSKEFFYACTSKATISKMEQVDKDEPQTSCKTCRYGEVDEGYVRCAYYSKSTEQDEPQSLEQFRVGLEYHTDTTHFGKVKGESITTNKVEDEPQTEREGE